MHRPVRIGEQVDVYFNLHRKCFSVRSTCDRIVIAHVGSFLLGDVVPIVSKAGKERVRRTGVKNVHAFLRGKWMGEVTDLVQRSVDTLRYNPFVLDSFVNSRMEQVDFVAQVSGSSSGGRPKLSVIQA